MWRVASDIQGRKGKREGQDETTPECSWLTGRISNTIFDRELKAC